MKVSVTNLGVIKQATVEVGGLTVFVGPNGAGKSYLAKVIYGLQQGEILTEIVFRNPVLFNDALLGKTVVGTKEVLQNLRQLTPAALQQAMPAIENLHAQMFKDQLADYFNDDSNLFSSATIAYSSMAALPAEVLQAAIDGVIKQYEPSLLSAELTDTYVLAMLIVFVFIKAGVVNADYFPAARSNFMLTYKALYRARADEYVGLDSSGIRSLLGSGGNTRKTGALIRFDKPTEDFIRQLYDLDSATEGPLAHIANGLQKRLYGEDRLVTEQAVGALPDFRYQIGNNANNKIRLHLASSMVTETSPLLIGLRHWVEPNSLVIIDEPESHLHPEAQSALISGLANAVNEGLKVILITHSPYILSCVNNLIKFGNLLKNFPDDNQVKKLQNEHSDLIALQKPVHAYHFGRDGEVKDIVMASGLIDEAEFTEPFDRINALYEAMRDIEWEHR